MPVSDDYLAYLEELLGAVPALRHKRMFGGAGLYSGEAMFALVADDTLYLKADAENRPLYEAEGSEQFSYLQKGKTAHMAYWSVTAEVLEDPERLGQWVDAAREAASRGKRKKR